MVQFISTHNSVLLPLLIKQMTTLVHSIKWLHKSYVTEMVVYVLCYRNVEVTNSAHHGMTLENVEAVRLQDITIKKSRVNGLYLKTISQKVQLQNIHVEGKKQSLFSSILPFENIYLISIFPVESKVNICLRLLRYRFLTKFKCNIYTFTLKRIFTRNLKHW